MKKKRLWLSATLAVGAALSLLLLLYILRSPPPSVLLISLDGLRSDHLSHFGYHRMTSPNIDELAEVGLVFPAVVLSGCSTKASLTSLMTSMDYRYHQRLLHSDLLDDSFVTLAEVFRAAGYRTGGFVASPHLATAFNYNQGFETYEDFVDRGADLVSAETVVSEAMAFIASVPKSDPFFVYLHLQEPHPPWTHKSPWSSGAIVDESFLNQSCTYMPTYEEFQSTSQEYREELIAKYDGSIYYADGQIGRVMNYLQEVGLKEKTLVAITTDHGIELMERYSATHGRNPFDEVVKGFLILSGTGEAGRVDRIQGRIFDIGPTLAARAGVEMPESGGFDLLSKSKRQPEFAFTIGYRVGSVRSLQYKLVFTDHARNPDWYLQKGSYMLFDLEKDPGETRDISQQESGVLLRMQRAFEQYKQDLARTFVPGTRIPDRKIDPVLYERLKSLGYIR